jgi:TRAP-type C4-dicarboxylate transport system substrate-binding protein
MEKIDKAVQESLIQKNVGIKIRELRKAGKMNAIDLASKAGISQGQLFKIETGKANVSIKNLARLCRILGRPLNYLFQTEDKSTAVCHRIIAVAGLENQGLHWFAQEVGSNTNGAVALNSLGTLQFGPAVDQINLIFEGSVDLFIENLVQFFKIAPALKQLSLPYCFRDEQHRQAFLASPYFRENVTDLLLQKGIRLLNPNWNWIRGLEWVLVSRRPICTPEDVKGLKVRIYDCEHLRIFWDEMGAIPVVVPWSKVRKAIASGQVDVVPTSKALVYHNGFCSNAKYVTILGDIPEIMGVFITETKYSSFSSEVQHALEKACDSAGNIFSLNLYHIEKKNERLNMSRYKAAYLKVDLSPWWIAVSRTRKKMTDQGTLPEQTLSEIEKV